MEFIGGRRYQRPQRAIRGLQRSPTVICFAGQEDLIEEMLEDRQPSTPEVTLQQLDPSWPPKQTVMRRTITSAPNARRSPDAGPWLLARGKSPQRRRIKRSLARKQHDPA